MLKITKSVLMFAAGLLIAGSAHANLIVNGGFEDNKVAAGGWKFFSAANVNGWEGSNIEIWNNLNGVVAPEGKQHAELNAHPYTGGVFSIFQDFATVVGQTYDVSFFYSARNNNGLNTSNEAFNFSVGTLNALINDHVKGVWSTFTNSFVATTTSTTLRFTSVNNSTQGNFLDGVVVTARASVPEAKSWMLLLVGLSVLVLVRRQARA